MGGGAAAPEAFAFLERAEFEPLHYESSAKLTRFLIQRYGVDAYRNVYADARHDETSQAIEDAFVSGFGDGIYDAFDEFVAGPQCGLRAWECEPSLVTTLELPVDLQSPHDCTEDAAWVGAAPTVNGRWYPHRRFLVRVDADTRVRTTAHNARLERSACDTSCPSPRDWPPGFENMAAVAQSGAAPVRTLTAGVHAFHLRPLDPSLPFSVRMERVE